MHDKIHRYHNFISNAYSYNIFNYFNRMIMLKKNKKSQSDGCQITGLAH